MVQGWLTANTLKCERVIDPVGISNPNPVFSWLPVAGRGDERQVAYRVLVASSPDLVSPDGTDLWDSGRVESEAVSGVSYAGVGLASRARCWWAVQLWDREGNPGAWSAPAPFEVALLTDQDWTAAWIGGEAVPTAPLLRSEFSLTGAVRSARAYVTGLGYYELSLNGAKVGDRVLEPAQTTYGHNPGLLDGEKRPTRIRSPRVLYSVYDITDRLRSGANAVGVTLGHGWYSFARDADSSMWHRWGDRPKALVQLEIELESGDRVVVSSDDTWRVADGPATYDHPVHGEHFDARLVRHGWDSAGFDDSSWSAALLLDAPGGALSVAAIEPIRVIETLEPVSITGLRPGVSIVDVGQHISGWTRIRVSGPAGGTITLRHASDVDADGELDDQANGVGKMEVVEAHATDVYTLDGTGPAIWEPRFTLHGFRYVEVTVTPGVVMEKAEARVVHSDIARAGTFRSSNELLNRIDENVRWTYRASFQGIPQDAADRAERLGWLGDPGWVIEDYLYEFDTLAFWAKWLRDIRDTQLDNGALPIVSPILWNGSYSTWPDWTATYTLIVWHLYRFSGDRALLEEHYEGLKELQDWFAAMAVEGIVSNGLGDHMEAQPDGTCNFAPLRTPAELTSTAWLYTTSGILAEIADVLGDTARAASSRAFAADVREAFNARFFDAGTGRYATSSQTSMAFPLWFGLVPEEHRDAVAANLAADILGRDEGHLATGTMGTPALEQVLADTGHADVMLGIATQTTFPSWGDQIRQGATTVWESWGPDWRYPDPDDPSKVVLLPGSRSMKLMAAISKFLYKDVAGLSLTAPGWRRLCIKPLLTMELESAEARVRTARGDAAVSWRTRDGGLAVDFEVPATSEADVWIPVGGVAAPVVRVGADVIWQGQESAAGDRADLRDVRRDGDYVRFEVGGGTYSVVVA